MLWHVFWFIPIYDLLLFFALCDSKLNSQQLVRQNMQTECFTFGLIYMNQVNDGE